MIWRVKARLGGEVRGFKRVTGSSDVIGIDFNPGLNNPDVVYGDAMNKLGGSDEDFCGNYGYTDPNLVWRAKQSGIVVASFESKEGLEKTIIFSSDHSSMQRNSHLIRQLFEQKKRGKIEWSNTYLRFHWNEQTLSEVVAPYSDLPNYDKSDDLPGPDYSSDVLPDNSIRQTVRSKRVGILGVHHRRPDMSYEDYIKLQKKKTLYPKKRKKWLNEEWDDKVNAFKASFTRLLHDKYVSVVSKTLTVGARVGNEIQALLDLGVKNSIGIDINGNFTDKLTDTGASQCIECGSGKFS
eukprot:g4066.t1